MPGGDPSALRTALSRNVKNLRRAQDLTLESLATRAHISRGMLLQVEQGRTNPSLATLCRLANALNSSLAELLEVGPAPVVRVVRRADQVVLWKGDQGGEGHLLAASESPNPLEFWDFRLAPGESFAAESQPRGAVEMIHVHTGSLTMRVEDELVDAAAGDTVVFHPDRPHEYRNPGTDWLHLTIANVERARS
jgi:transcriptional regulator with XRE-family HTH domain